MTQANHADPPSNPAPSSLACALQAATGHDLPLGDLNCVLGLPLLICASQVEPLALWDSLARDMFLFETARLFGLTIREIHPPEAACGLRGAKEFRQHFEASYRPLILRALENGQSVLAWRGWTGSAESLWGTVDEPCNEGIGLKGSIFSVARGDASNRINRWEHPLDLAPVQLYVVESQTRVTSSSEALVRTALDHARSALLGDRASRFGVVVGPPALQTWVDQIAAGTRGDSIQASWNLAVRLAADCQIFRQFLTERSTQATGSLRHVAESVSEGCQKVADSLLPIVADGSAGDAMRTGNVVPFANPLAAVAGELAEMRDLLAEMPRSPAKSVAGKDGP